MQSLNTNLMNCGTKTGGRACFFSQYFVLFAVLIFSIYQYGIRRIYGFSIYPDEFGYWASAAEWVGFDWSEMVSLAPYYSFGYSLILAPVLCLFKSGVAAYRAAVTVNMLLQCLSIGCLWGIYRRIFGGICKKSKTHADSAIIFAVGAAIFYPVWTFYTQMTLAEALLAFLYTFICWQFVLFLGRQKLIHIMLLSIAFVYLHFVHMRTVGVVIAGVLTLILYAWQEKKARKVIFMAFLIMLAGTFTGMRIKNLVTDMVYAHAEEGLLSANDYSGQLANLKTLFNRDALLTMLQSCAGKLYYLGMSSFGLFYPAVGYCLKRSVGLFWALFLGKNGKKKKSEKAMPEEMIVWTDWMAFFFLLSMSGQFLVSAIFMRGSGRLDNIIYGRYNDYFVPVFIGIGVLVLFEGAHLLRNLFLYMGISTALFGSALWSALHSGAVLMHGCHAVGLNYLSDDLHYYRIVPEFVKAYLFGILLMVLVTGCVFLIRRLGKKSLAFGIGILLLIEIALTLCLDEKYIFHFNDMNYYDLEVYEYIEDDRMEDMSGEMDMADNDGADIYYLHDGGQVYINLIQFVMREESLQFIYEEQEDGSRLSWDELEPELPEKGFLIVDCNNDYLTQLEQKYRKCLESKSGGFVLFGAK